MSDKLLTTREAARFLRASEASLRRWADSGLLPASRVGRRRARRFKEDDLLRFMGPDQGGPSPAITGLPRALAIEGMAVELGSHLGSFYSNDAGRLRLGLPFLRDGIRSGQACVLFAMPEVVDHYLRALRREGIDIDAAQRDGLLTILTLLTFGSASSDGFIARLEEVFIDVLRRLPGTFRYLGEPSAALRSLSSAKAVLTMEHHVGALAKRFPMVMLCANDVQEFDGPTVLECLKLHYDTFGYELGYFLS
jgi:excisionase family DNA binding protein